VIPSMKGLFVSISLNQNLHAQIKQHIGFSSGQV